MRILKSTAAVLLSALLLISLFSFAAFAQDENPQPYVSPAVTEPEAQPYVGETTPAQEAEAGKLIVNFKSNVSESKTVKYITASDTNVTFTFNLKTALKIVNTQGYMTYDSEYLALESFELLKVANATVNTEQLNRVDFNSTDIDTPADFSAGGDLVKASFKIVKEGITDVDFNLDELNAVSDDKDVALVSDSAAVSTEFTGACDLSTPSADPSATEEPKTASDVKLSATSKSLKAGKTFTLKVTGTSEKASFSVTSGKKSAMVSSSGKVTALKKGTAVITVKAAGKTLKCNVKVTSSPKAKINKKAFKKSKTYSIKKGKSLKVKITGKASSVKNSYKSSAKKIAKVTSNKNAKTVKIKGVKKGKATITIKVNKYQTFKIKVKVK